MQTKYSSFSTPKSDNCHNFLQYRTERKGAYSNQFIEKKKKSLQKCIKKKSFFFYKINDYLFFACVEILCDEGKGATTCNQIS